MERPTESATAPGAAAPAAAAAAQATATEARAVLDLDAALRRVEGDWELLGDLARLLLEDAPRRLAELDQAAARGDLRGVQRSAHALKGAVANFDASEARGAARAVELAARQGELAELGALLAALRGSWDRLAVALARIAGT